MNREIRDKWVAALRSGDYQQTKGRLHRAVAVKGKPVGHCCLGVLCDIMGVPKKLDRNLYRYKFIKGISNASMPPDNFAGLRFSFDGMKDVYDLARLNDDGKSFAKIADWIENNIPVED